MYRKTVVKSSLLWRQQRKSRRALCVIAAVGLAVFLALLFVALGALYSVQLRALVEGDPLATGLPSTARVAPTLAASTDPPGEAGDGGIQPTEDPPGGSPDEGNDDDTLQNSSAPPLYSLETLQDFPVSLKALKKVYEEKILTQCDSTWVTAQERRHHRDREVGTSNYSKALAVHVKRVAELEGNARRRGVLPLVEEEGGWTYDLLSRATIERDRYIYDEAALEPTVEELLCASHRPDVFVKSSKGSVSTSNRMLRHLSSLCDTSTIPFIGKSDTQCLAFAMSHLRSALEIYRAASPPGTSTGTSQNGSPCDLAHRQHLADTADMTAVEQEQQRNWVNRTGWCVAIPMQAETFAAANPDNALDEDARRVGGAENFQVQVVIDPVAPSFEQRTIKFKLELTVWLSGGEEQKDDTPRCPLETYVFLVKVPQLLFPPEPFTEYAAYRSDRALGVRRVPPTFIEPVPVSLLWGAIQNRTKKDIPIVPEFVRGPSTSTYDKWVETDFLNFLKEHSAQVNPEVYTHNHGENVWCSFQLFMREVRPLLDGPLTVPYRKSSPGWHRWFSPAYDEIDVSYRALAALSEQAMLDYIMSNNDRSPNKNSFVAGGCRRCGVGSRRSHRRRPSGSIPTTLHLDHGLSFLGRLTIPNSPLSKSTEKATFCMFYRPLVLRLWAIERELFNLEPTHAACSGSAFLSTSKRRINVHREARKKHWKNLFSSVVPSFLTPALGHTAIGTAGSQTVRLLERVDVCLRKFSEEVVLIP